MKCKYFTVIQERKGIHSVSYSTLMDNHVKSNTTCSLYFCDTCGRSYKHKGNLTTHKRLECGKEPQYKCPYCGKLSFHKSSMKSHVYLQHFHLLESEKKNCY